MNSRSTTKCKRPWQELNALCAGALLIACSSDAINDAAPAMSNPGASLEMPSAGAAAGGMANTAGASEPAASGPSNGADNLPGDIDGSMLNGMSGTPGRPGGGASGTGAAETAGGTAGMGGGPLEEPTRACPNPALAPGDSTQTLTVANMNRAYILHVPNTYSGDQPVPLVIDFHGFGGNGQGQRNSSSYVAATESDGAILAFPSGLSDGAGPGFNFGPCCVSGVDDVAFARAMVAQIQESACIDDRRIYAVGFSNGGGMSYKLACDAPDLFAAVAPAAFDFTVETVDACAPSRPISVVAQRGTNDPVVPFDGAFIGVVPNHPMTNLGAQATFDKWAELDGCTGAAEDIGNGCVTRSPCDAGVEITLCTIQGGGHQPGNANVLWPLLREFSLP